MPTYLNVKAIVLAKRPAGEKGEFLDILTSEYGVIEIYARNSGKITNTHNSSTQLLAYSEFSLHLKKNGYGLSSASPIRIFYELRVRLEALSLASYFSEMIRFAVLPQTQTVEIQRLFLTALHHLEKRQFSDDMIKAVFELRLASLLGFLPDVIMCRHCGEYMPLDLCFSIEEGSFCCRDCTPRQMEIVTGIISMPQATLLAIRHVVLREFEEIFFFHLSERASRPFYDFAEGFIGYHLDHRFPTLTYYHSIKGVPL